MNKQHFERLVKGVREMKRHVAGKTVRGAKSTEPNSRPRHWWLMVEVQAKTLLRNQNGKGY